MKSRYKIGRRKFVFYFYRTPGFDISLGISLAVYQPNIEFHLPGGYIRVGWLGARTFSNVRLPYGYDGLSGGWCWGQTWPQ